MTKHFSLSEVGRIEPIETREEDPIVAATTAVNELRTANEQFRTNMQAELRSRDERIAQLETRLNRPGAGNPANEQTEIERRAFDTFLRQGRERMSADEVRSLTATGSDTGPDLIPPPQFLQELQRNLVLVSPIRALSRVRAVSNPQVILPKRTANLTASWVAETDSEPDTSPTYGSQTTTVYEAKASVKVSNRLLEDSAFDVAADLAFDLAQEYGRLEGAAFVNGSGTNQPLGLLGTTGVNSVTSLAAGAVGADDIFDLFYSLPTFYASQSTWVMNRSTISAIRKLKTSIGSYLWQPSLTAGDPASLLGRPVVEAPDMPNVATGNNAIAFGAFGLGFRIFDRIALTLLRDPFSQASSGFVVFHSRRRLGASVSLPEAFSFLKIS